jgi:hypothetical protein
VLDSDPCRVVVLFNREEASLCPTLISYSPAVVGKSSCLWSKYSYWVLKRAKEIHRVVGASCVAFEEQFMAILTIVEASRLQKVSGSNSKLGRKGSRELK